MYLESKAIEVPLTADDGTTIIVESTNGEPVSEIRKEMEKEAAQARLIVKHVTHHEKRKLIELGNRIKHIV